MKKIVLVISTALFVVACGTKESNEKEKVDSTKTTVQIPESQREEILRSIRYYDSLTKVPGQNVPDRDIAQKLISSYNKYVEFFPDDTVSPGFAYLASQVAVTVYSDQQALVLIDNTLKKYPKHPERVQMLFWKAMVYDDRLNDKDRAKLVYEQIIKEYPGTPAEQQAKDALKWTGKSDLEMIREMEKKNGIK